MVCRPEGEYRQDVEDGVHGKIAEEEADGAAANQSAARSKQGRLLLLGDELDTTVQAYVESIRKLGDIVNTAIVLGGTEAIIADRKRCSRTTSHSKNTSVRRVTGCV